MYTPRAFKKYVTGTLLALGLLVVAGPKVVSADTASASNVQIVSVFTYHNVVQNDQKGMRITAKLKLNGLRGEVIDVAAFFETRSGQKLKDVDGRYGTNKGNVSTSKRLVPKYDRTNATVNLFIPISQLHLGTGHHRLRYFVEVRQISPRVKLLALSRDQFFTADRGGAARQVTALGGSNWTGGETLNGYGRLRFRFYNDGSVSMVDTAGSHPGTWTKIGNQVTLRFFNGACIYTGSISGTDLAGSATNSAAKSWTFRVSMER